MKILSNAFKIFLLKDHLLRSYDLGSMKFIIMKFIWLHGFNILVHVICRIWQTAPCWDQINKIIWVAHLLQNLFEIVSLIPISTVHDLPLHYYSLLEIGMWVIGIHIYLICIFVVKGSPFQRFKGHWKEGQIGFPTSFGMALHFSPKQKCRVAKWISNCIFLMIEWSTDTKNGHGDLEVYMEYGYVFVSSTGRNHAKMATLS